MACSSYTPSQILQFIDTYIASPGVIDINEVLNLDNSFPLLIEIAEKYLNMMMTSNSPEDLLYDIIEHRKRYNFEKSNEQRVLSLLNENRKYKTYGSYILDEPKEEQMLRRSPIICQPPTEQQEQEYQEVNILGDSPIICQPPPEEQEYQEVNILGDSFNIYQPPPEQQEQEYQEEQRLRGSPI
ncbi:MAG: hypothetical protein WD512_16300, partial [Candidatus Paceibacterota bacterium]